MLIRIEDMLDPSFKSYSQLKLKEKHFKDNQSLFVIFAPEEKFDNTQACVINQWMHQQNIYNQQVLSIFSQFNIRKPVATKEKMLYALYQKDPCSLPPNNTFKSKVGGTPWKNLLTDKKQRDILYQISFKKPESSKYGDFNFLAVKKILEQSKALLSKNQIKAEVYIGGSSAFQWFLANGIQKDQWINLVALLMIVVLFKLFFGSFKGGFLLCLSLLFSGSWLMGVIGYFGFNIDILMNSLFIMLIIGSVQDFLFLSLDQSKNSSLNFNNFKSYLLPCFLTTFTTMVGFGSLVFSDLEIISRFGMLAALGSFFEWISVFIVLPAVLHYFKSLRVWTVPKKLWSFGLMEKINHFQLPSCFAMLVVMFGFAFGVYGLLNLKVNDSPKKGFPKSHALHKNINYLAESRGWESSVEWIYKTIDHQSTDRFDRFVDKLNNPNITKHLGLKQVNHFLTEGMGFYRKRIILSDFSDTSVYKAYQSNTGWTREFLYLKDASLDKLDALKQKTSAFCKDDDCFLVGALAAYLDFSKKIIPSLMKSFFVSLALVAFIIVLLAWNFVGLKTLFWLIICSFWGVFMMLGFYYFADFPVNYVSCIFAAILVGMAGDNGIQYVCKSRNKNINYGVSQLGVGSICICFMMMCFSLVFLFSVFLNPRILGVLFCFGFVFSLLGDLWLFRSFLNQSDKAH